jgi:hypothetical protein
VLDFEVHIDYFEHYMVLGLLSSGVGGAVAAEAYCWTSKTLLSDGSESREVSAVNFVG